LQKAVKTHRSKTDRHPSKAKGQADLPSHIQGHTAIIPNPIGAVEQKSRRKFHHRHNTRTHQASGQQRQPGAGILQLSQQQKTAAAGKEHAAVAAASPQQFQGHITASAQQKQDKYSQQFQRLSPRKQHPQKNPKNTEKYS
jgi:hypothetical protein